MPVFKIQKNKATKINQKQFKDELELHDLIDKNLKELFSIRYIKKEHITDKHGRIETLGIDESNRPVVLEYKKTKEKGQLAQANRYMIWILQNPDSFELLVRKNIETFKGEIDFGNPRIICFAQDYNIDDKCLALSLDAELWKYRYYENNILVITREEEPEQLIKRGTKTTIKKIEKKPQTVKTVEEHLKGASKDLTNSFVRLNDFILDISSEIERYTTNAEIIYKTSVGFVSVSIQKKNNRLRALLRTINDKINDPLKLTEKVPKTHGWGNFTRIVYIEPKQLGKKYTLENVFDLVLQSYNSTQ